VGIGLVGGKDSPQWAVFIEHRTIIKLLRSHWQPSDPNPASICRIRRHKPKYSWEDWVQSASQKGGVPAKRIANPYFSVKNIQ